MVIFVQIEGDDKGKEVEVVEEGPYDLRIRNVSNGFVFSISIRDFQRCYKRKENDNG